MATSASRHGRVNRPLGVFLVGKYFEFGPNGPDYNGIERNVQEVLKIARRLIEEGFMTFVPHNNSHHFEFKTVIYPEITDKKERDLKNEDFYRAFDRRMYPALDCTYGIWNAANSTGGRLEMQLANHLEIPVFNDMRYLLSWASASEEPYATVTFNKVSEEALHFGEEHIKIAVVDGPHWVMDGVELDTEAVAECEQEAERHAVELFNQKIACFTPHQNASYRRLGMRTPDPQYHGLTDRVLERVADAMFLIPGWEDVPEVKERVRRANALGKPCFASKNEMLKWRDGNPDFASIVMH